MGRNPRVHEDMVAEWARLYADGATIDEVAAQVGFAHCTVHRHLVERGVVMRSRGFREVVAPTRERRALRALDRFIENNRDDLLAIAHWGDGNCGFIAERIAQALGVKGRGTP